MAAEFRLFLQFSLLNVNCNITHETQGWKLEERLQMMGKKTSESKTQVLKKIKDHSR